MEKKYPKLIQDFIDVQLKYPDAIILTEVGGFFEIWQLDELNLGHAIKASQILDIALTRRDKSKLDSPRMAGFPSYTVENYIKKLVDAGETVVVVKQEINGKKTDQNKNVRRFVERIISPGTIITSGIESKPHYFASTFMENDFVGVCLIDISTGEVRISEMPKDQSLIYLENNNPVEILFCNGVFLDKKEKQIFHENKDPIKKQTSAGTVLSKIYEIENPSSNNSVVLSKIGINFWPLGTLALANLLNFLTDYNPLLLKKISTPDIHRLDSSLFLSKNAYMSLDILESPIDRDSNKTLLGTLDECKTSMGKRSLFKIIQNPLTDIAQINERLDLVDYFINKNDFLEELSQVYDISRLTRRMSLKNLMPHEIISFLQSLEISNKSLLKIKKDNKEISKLVKFINSNIDINNLEKNGLDNYNFLIGKSEKNVLVEKNEWLSLNKKLKDITEEISRKLDTDKLRISEKQESIQLIGPKGLHSKCKEKNVEFKVKASEIQIFDKKWEETASNEFYLKRKYLIAAEKQWLNLQEEIVNKFGNTLLDFSNEIGKYDVLSNFAKISKNRNYTRPNFVKGSAFLDFKKVRHPIVEKSKELSETYISNDIFFDNKNKMMVLYGPNSSGKSTLLKSIALNIIMAQCGCFIAANQGSSLSIFDSIMTRMTTYDSLSEGLSTFTMEMIELQNAIKRKSENSLFLFDEIGRGTSVEDGEAIAFSTISFLNNKETNALTLFSTHYHSIYEKIKDDKNIRVNHMACHINENQSLIFSRKLEEGPGSGSYGILVAKSCGLPQEIIRMAENYKKDYKKLFVSRYNSSVQGSECEICHKEQATETHHIIEQLQGKVDKITINGVDKGINDKGNLVLICPNCHDKITKNKIKINKRKVIGKGSESYQIDIDEE